MKPETSRQLINFLIIFLILGLLITAFFIMQYAKSEGFKCLSNPMEYALNHTVFEVNGNIVNLPTYINSTQKEADAQSAEINNSIQEGISYAKALNYSN